MASGACPSRNLRAVPAQALGQSVEFNRDIRPIFAEARSAP
jgi:hypothetical protein